MDFSLPLTGMRDANRRLDATAARIAGYGNDLSSVETGSATPTDTADLSADTVALLKAKNDFAANVRMAKVEADLERSTFSLLG